MPDPVNDIPSQAQLSDQHLRLPAFGIFCSGSRHHGDYPALATRRTMCLLPSFCSRTTRRNFTSDDKWRKALNSVCIGHSVGNTWTPRIRWLQLANRLYPANSVVTLPRHPDTTVRDRMETPSSLLSVGLLSITQWSFPSWFLRFTSCECRRGVIIP